MHIGVVGGCGFVGLNIAAEALAQGHTVTLFDRDPPPAPFSARHPARFVRIDVTRGDTLAGLSGRRIDVLIHGAAITSGAARDAAEPERVMMVNLMGFMAVMRAARDAGIARVVNLSSVAAYGAAGARHDPLVEDETPSEPKTLYAISKFATEGVGARLGALWGLDVRSVRLSSLFGPWERATGVRDTLSPHWQLMQAATQGRPALLPGEGWRDWTYAPDAARAVLALARLDAPRHRLHNISRGQRASVLAYGQAVARHWPGFECRLAQAPEVATIDLQIVGDRGSLSTARLAADLGSSVVFRDPEDTLEETIAWWRDMPGVPA